MISQAPSLSLALQYHQSGQLDAAAELYREILAAAPQNADAWHLLGLVALQAGNYDLAVNQIQRAIRLKNGVAAFHSNLGVAYQSMKKLDEATACFRRSIKLAPNQAEAHNNLANVLREQGKVQEAIASWRRAVAMMPNYIDAWSNLAIALRQLGSVEESIACLREVHRLKPDRADYCNNLGSALHGQGKLDEAIALYRRAIQCDPGFALPHNNLGNVLQEQGQLAEACQCYQRAIELKPDFAEAHVGLASTQNEQGNSTEAIHQYLTAIQIKPGLAAAHCNLGIVLEEQGDFAGAEKCFRSAIASDSLYSAAHAELASLLRAALPAEDMAALQQLLADSALPQAQQAALHFGLAQVFDARGAYAEAADHASLANALRLAQWGVAGHAYDRGAHSQFVNAILAEFTPELFARVHDFGVPTERPVFLVGLPRSGTTLIEQILASHSQVFAVGELPLTRDAFAAACTSKKKPGYSGLDREPVQRMALGHLDELQRRSATALRVVDKMPDNYLYLGFLAALFPRARFIHCRRNMRDVAVSCWMANFRDIRWASAPDDIVARFRDYQRLMDRWREVLPTPILEVSYEETVTDLETVARRLVAWCGLEWEPGCLEFHRGKRTVRTASAVQVRQSLYTTSVGRWQHYEHSLASLFARLDAVRPAG
ncbi:MAG: tetratricopeptide repeat protein [Thermoguttaceae bacterium]